MAENAMKWIGFNKKHLKHLIKLLIDQKSKFPLMQVGKMDDPTTARLGEPLYRFIPRSVWGNIVDGWQAESRRLKARQMPFFCAQNRYTGWLRR